MWLNLIYIYIYIYNVTSTDNMCTTISLPLMLQSSNSSDTRVYLNGLFSLVLSKDPDKLFRQNS